MKNFAQCQCICSLVSRQSLEEGLGRKGGVWERDNVYVANVQFKYSGKEFCLRFLTMIIYIGLEEV